MNPPVCIRGVLALAMPEERLDIRHGFGTLAVQVFPLSDVKAYMGRADIATTMIYVDHVPQADAAEKLSSALSEVAGVAEPAAHRR